MMYNIINPKKLKGDQKMQLITPNKKLFALVYGVSGSGKTHLAATYALWHPEENVLLVDVDQGSETLKAKEFSNARNLFVISFDTFKDLDELYTLCKNNTVQGWIQAIPELKGKLNKPFKCGIIDTWTELQWVLLTELRRKNSRLGQGLDFRQNIEIQHWGQMTDINKLSVISFKDLEMEFLFLMQAQVKEDKATGALVKGPSIHGKLVLEFPAYFTTVIYTYNTPQGEWKATTLPKMGWPAKVRGKVGKDMANPTLKELLL